MSGFIAWCGFLGAWLLVAGPLYQASIELQEQDLEREKIAEATRSHRDAPISPWWWLVPPVRYALARRRVSRSRDAILATLAPEEMEDLIRYINKASGWLYVSTGGFLIAMAETWALREHYDWPVAVFWVLLVVMLLAAMGNVSLRSRRSHQILEEQRHTAGA
jgi:hypothetical protein